MVSSKPTESEAESEADEHPVPGVDPEAKAPSPESEDETTRSASSPSLGPMKLPSGGLDETDRQNLKDTMTAAPRLPGLSDPEPPNRAIPDSFSPEGEEDPGVGWFQTNPPPEARTDQPESGSRIDPMTWVLLAIGIGVVVILGGIALM